MHVYYAVDMNTGQPVTPHMYGLCSKNMLPFRVFWSPTFGDGKLMVSTGDIINGLDSTLGRDKNRIEQSLIREEAFGRGCELNYATEWLVPLRSSGMYLHSLFAMDTLLDYLMKETSQGNKKNKRSILLRSMAEEDQWMTHIITSIEFTNRWKVVLEAWSEYMSTDNSTPSKTLHTMTDTRNQILPKKKTTFSLVEVP